MPTPPAAPPPAPPDARVLPPVVEGMLRFFYGVIWASLLFDTVLATLAAGDAGRGDYRFLLPVGLYALLLAGFTLLNRRGGRHVPLSDQFWGEDRRTARQAAFILISFALVAWLSALVPMVFSWFYIALWSQTLGMFRWRMAIPLLAGEVVAWGYQSGVVGAIWPPSSADAGAIAILISVVFFFLYAFLISILLKSQVRSGALVQELQATQRRLEAAQAHEKEVAVLRERDRMAREMHDVLGHALALVAVKIEAAQRLQAVDPARAAAELEATKGLVRESMTDLRRSLADMRSPALAAADQPLAAALGAWAATTARASGLALETAFEPGLDSLPAPVQDALWRVGREALLNVVKHAGARQVDLRAYCRGGSVYLSVADDGVGIPHLADGSARLEVAGHYGMRGMRERVELLGGRLTVRPRDAGSGTVVLASVPLPAGTAPPTSAASPADGMQRRLGPVRHLFSRPGREGPP